jgi:hypothetical protein
MGGGWGGACQLVPRGYSEHSASGSFSSGKLGKFLFWPDVVHCKLCFYLWVYTVNAPDVVWCMRSFVSLAFSYAVQLEFEDLLIGLWEVYWTKNSSNVPKSSLPSYENCVTYVEGDQWVGFKGCVRGGARPALCKMRQLACSMGQEQTRICIHTPEATTPSKVFVLRRPFQLYYLLYILYCMNTIYILFLWRWKYVNHLWRLLIYSWSC